MARHPGLVKKPYPPERLKSERVQASVTPGQMASYKAAAERAGLSLIAWYRQVLDEAAADDSGED